MQLLPKGSIKAKSKGKKYPSLSPPLQSPIGPTHWLSPVGKWVNSAGVSLPGLRSQQSLVKNGSGREDKGKAAHQTSVSLS